MENPFLDPPPTRVEGASGDITGAPLEGNVRENDGVPLSEEGIKEAKAREVANDFVPDSGPLLTNDDRLPPFEGGRLTEPNKDLKEKIEKKLEDKNPESVKADLASEMGNPPVGGSSVQETRNPSRTIQRNDGTITTADRPQETAHYIAGSRVMITEEQKAKHDTLAGELNKAQDGRAISDIPPYDAYWDKKKEFDSFTSRLKR